MAPRRGAFVRIGVIGSGIAGAASAWLLSRAHEVTLIDGADRAGGHTDTLVVTGAPDGPYAVDTGFIVFNEVTYPLFVRLLDELEVASVASDMSWGLRCERCDLEYAGDARGVLAQPRRLLDPAYLRMLRDIARFNRVGSAAIGPLGDPSIPAAPDARTHGAGTLADGTIGDAGILSFLDRHGLGAGFRRHYLLPMVAAIWSSGTAAVEEFPTRSLLAFFANHGLLGVRSHLAWRTVKGGAARYLERLLEPLQGRIRLGSPVEAVRRSSDRVTVFTADGRSEDFDALVIATRADDALGFLTDPSDDERELLGAWTSSRNERVVHTDASLLPQRRAAHASWSYHVEDCLQPSGRASLSYYMNRLQELPGPEDVLVSINPVRSPRPETVIRRDLVSHPTFTAAAVATQPDLDRLNGANRTYFAGAWQRWGFHEDGLWSAVRVAAHLGVAWP
jgi:predicted NAD/FAD-binding protein